MGMIGETYQVNFTHAAYCSTGKTVPYIWTNGTVPSGVGNFLALTSYNWGNVLNLTSIPDSTTFNSAIGAVGYLDVTSTTRLTAFGCEAK